MSIDQLLAVFRVEFVLDHGPRVAQVEHELAGAADDLVGALRDHGDFLDWRHFGEFVRPFVLLFQRLNVAIVVLDVAHHQDRQDRLRVRVDVVAPES